MEFKLAITHTAGVSLLKVLEKKIDMTDTVDLKEKIFLEIANGNARIVLDLSNVEEIDSSGLGALLFGKRQANAAKGDLVLLNANKKIKTILRIAQLSHVFVTFDKPEAAIDFLNNPEP
ncbi:MAG: STAS domain-containing protein [Calditrichia bacterium]